MLPDLTEIRMRRKMAGITQDRLAKLVGTSQSAIAKIENGKITPNYNLAKRIFDTLEELECREEKKARDIMNRHPITVQPSDDVETARNLLLRHGISQMPVVENEKVVGRINESILLRKEGKTCAEIMGLPYPSVNEETPVKVVREILKREELVVVHGRGNIKGVITKSDLLKV